MAKKTKRPEGTTDEHLEFLDELRESGVTNMFGAPAYLQDKFYFNKHEAQAVVKYWMETFGKANR